MKRTERHPSEFAREAFNLMLEKYEGREFGSLVSRRTGDNPLVRHARRVSEATEAPALRRAGCTLASRTLPLRHLPAKPAKMGCSATSRGSAGRSCRCAFPEPSEAQSPTPWS